MKIVILDGYTLNPGDLNWSKLQALGECTVHDRTPAVDTVRRASGHEIVLTNKVVLSREQLKQLPGLKYVGVLATGTNIVDVGFAAERGIVVTNVPNYSTPSVAQLTFALLLELTTGVGKHSDGVRSGKWSRSLDFSYTEQPLLELQELTLGIVGYGRIGQCVAQIARAFGMNILAHTRTRPDDAAGHVKFVDLEVLFRESDVISLHCPQTPATTRMVNPERLALMKPSAFIINTSRGPLVDETALARALNDGQIAGAVLDVLSSEPPAATNPLLHARNCILTPHIGWATTAARQRLMRIAVRNVQAFLAGAPENVVLSS